MDRFFHRKRSEFASFLILIMLILLAQDCVFLQPVFAGSKPQQNFSSGFSKRVFNPGDAVQVSVYPDTTSFLHGVFPIDGTGNLFLPVRGKVNISNMSRSDLENYIKQNFTDYLRYPNVQVRPLIRASALGGFAKPGLYYIDPDLTLWNLVHKAGGTTKNEGLKKMKWRRDKDVISSNLLQFYESGQSLREIGFKSGDQIWTPLEEQKGFLELIDRVLPYISFATSMYITYITIAYIQRTGQFRR
jgi:protein involved in polysaccharide export with SLBB domain